MKLQCNVQNVTKRSSKKNNGYNQGQKLRGTLFEGHSEEGMRFSLESFATVTRYTQRFVVCDLSRLQVEPKSYKKVNHLCVIIN